MKRRTFVKKTVQSGLAISALPVLNYCGEASSTMLPKRKLGKTGEELSVIGFGGILVMNETAEESARRVSHAIDLGCNYFDVAPTYGNAEEMLGPVLEPYRKDCFLACKTNRRDAAGAEQEIHESLQKLRTDYFDLYQLHALSGIQEVEECFAPGGAMEPILKAQEAGKIRFLGFSAHSQQAALFAMDTFDFDSILFPVNFVCMEEGDFGPAALERADEKGMGILALKALALTLIPEGEPRAYDKCWYIPIEDEALSSKSLRYTLDLGVTAAIPPGEYTFWTRAVDIVRSGLNITKDEVAELKSSAQGLAPLFKA
jgi:aryl-alcohol dehydrogenase-like predicted oxidoreductase